MNLKARLYFSPLGYIIHIITYLYAFIGGRCLIYGYRDKASHKYLHRCRMASTVYYTHKERLHVEDNVWINHYVRIDATGGVSIGEGCQIGYGACILSHSSHNAIRLMGYKYMEYSFNERIGYILKPVKIGSYTFVGGGSYIMPGVTIGKGCVIGVNSVVTRDLPDYSVAVGSPARIIASTKDIDNKYLHSNTINLNYYE